MRNINLLPPKQRQKQLALTLATYTTLGFIVLVLTIAGFAITLTTVQVTINDKIGFYQDQTAAIKKQIDAYKTLETDLELTNKALQQTTTALDSQSQPLPIIKKISQLIGPDISFTSFSIIKPTTAAANAKTTSADLKIAITGLAKERANVIDFKRALELVPELKSIVYTFSAGGASAIGGTAEKASLSFTLNASYTTEATK